MNVHACLVHERPDLVRDLVDNLQTLDPDSAVVLYNGGRDASLLLGDWPEGVLVHPHPRPQRYGHLHGYMLDCMSFSVACVGQFTSITVVDSDQLLAQPGYSEFVGEYLKCHPGVGCLATHHVAPQVSIWTDHEGPCIASARAVARPWRERFSELPGGERSYGHWSFWPTTCFSSEAAWRISTLVLERPRLIERIDGSKVFATEELFLPSLTSAVDLEVAETPCDTTYVNFDDRTAEDVSKAQTTPGAFWMHRIPRDTANPARLKLGQLWGYHHG